MRCYKSANCKATRRIGLPIWAPPPLNGGGVGVWSPAVLYGIVLGLALMLSSCTDLKKDFLCRPEGHCVNAPDGGHGIGP